MTRRDQLRLRFVFMLTLSRLPMAVAFAIAYPLIEISEMRIGVGITLILMMEFTDFLDGKLARTWGVTSELGAMADPYIDSVSKLIVYWTLASAGKAWWLVPLVISIRDFTVAYARIEIARQGKSVMAKWSGKIKAAIQATGSGLLVGGPVIHPYVGTGVDDLVCLIVILVTVVSGVEYVRDAVGVATKTS